MVGQFAMFSPWPEDPDPLWQDDIPDGPMRLAQLWAELARLVFQDIGARAGEAPVAARAWLCMERMVLRSAAVIVDGTGVDGVGHVAACAVPEPIGDKATTPAARAAHAPEITRLAPRPPAVGVPFMGPSCSLVDKRSQHLARRAVGWS
jgi:hypothetical protein